MGVAILCLGFAQQLTLRLHFAFLMQFAVFPAPSLPPLYNLALSALVPHSLFSLLSLSACSLFPHLLPLYFIFHSRVALLCIAFAFSFLTVNSAKVSASALSICICSSSCCVAASVYVFICIYVCVFCVQLVRLFMLFICPQLSPVSVSANVARCCVCTLILRLLLSPLALSLTLSLCVCLCGCKCIFQTNCKSLPNNSFSSSRCPPKHSL